MKVFKATTDSEKTRNIKYIEIKVQNIINELENLNEYIIDVDSKGYMCSRNNEAIKQLHDLIGKLKNERNEEEKNKALDYLNDNNLI